jgi:hypothetical protein
MTIEIHEPELEALIRARMETGAFRSVEEALMQALKAAPVPELPIERKLTGTGADIVAAMQRIPYRDVDLEPERLRMNVREPVTFE